MNLEDPAAAPLIVTSRTKCVALIADAGHRHPRYIPAILLQFTRPDCFAVMWRALSSISLFARMQLHVPLHGAVG